MRQVKAIHQDSNFAPDYLATSMSDIDFEQLVKDGVTHIAFDADSTLVNFRGKILEKDVKQLLLSKRHLFKGWCVASNRIQDDLHELAASIDAQVVRATITVRKPQKRYFKRVINHLNANPNKIAMVGDKLFADVWGANRAGLKTVWVEHVGPDSPWDWLLRTRMIEQFITKRYTR